jgi:hypothetical protein
MATSKSVSRNRFSLLLCIITVIAMGLASRKFPSLFPAVFDKYPGDALWGLMLYFMVAFVKKTSPASRIAVLTFLISAAVEFSQLIQISWLNDFRHTVIGHLILGTVFSWYDLLAYTVGICIGLLFDKIVLGRKMPE